MPKCKLKIMVKLSDPNNNEFIELTKNILEYNPEANDPLLEQYPFFDPDIHFDSRLRNKIQKMPYKEKLQVFFNENKYDSVVGYINKQTNSNKKLTKKQIENAFEFTLQCILCTGFPVGNYYRSMEFYDNHETKKKVVGNRSNPILAMSFPSSNCYSYIKSNQKEYTVAGVRWLNDALSNPIYKNTIDYYGSYMLEKNERIQNNPLEKIKKIFNEKLNTLFLDIYHNRDVWAFQEEERVPYYISREKNDTIQLKKTLKKVFENIQKYEQSPFLRLEPNDNNIVSFMQQYENGENQMSRNRDQKKETVQELMILQYEAIKSEKNSHRQLFSVVDDFLNKNVGIITLRNGLKDLVKKMNETDLETFSSYTAPFKTKFISHMKGLKDLLFKEDAFEAVFNKTDFYSIRNKKDTESIEGYIKKEFPNYSMFLDSINTLYNTIEITNPFWKHEIYKILGRGRDKLNKKTDAVQNTNLFEILVNCNDKNSQCHRSITPTSPEFLDVGLNLLKNYDNGNNKSGKKSFNSTTTVYEAFVLLDVVEGKINGDNLKGIMCPYSNNLLGNYFSKTANDSYKNYIVHDTLFVPLKEQVKQINDSIKIQKMRTKKNKTLKQQSPKQGGRSYYQNKKYTRKRDHK